jgi:hypothetical protein
MEAPLRECQTGGESAIRPDGKNSTSHDAWNVISITGQEMEKNVTDLHAQPLAHRPGIAGYRAVERPGLQAIGWADYTGQP